MTTNDETTWRAEAREQARRAHEELFENHRGVFPLEDRDDGDTIATCIYSNHPHTTPERRLYELQSLRAYLRSHGIVELGFAWYPIEGESAGYTFAMIVDSIDVDTLCAAWDDIVERHTMHVVGGGTAAEAHAMYLGEIATPEVLS